MTDQETPDANTVEPKTFTEIHHILEKQLGIIAIDTLSQTLDFGSERPMCELVEMVAALQASLGLAEAHASERQRRATLTTTMELSDLNQHAARISDSLGTIATSLDRIASAIDCGLLVNTQVKS